MVVVVDPRTVQVVQVLDCHAGYIVKVKWARENYRHNLASPYCLRLAAADFNGHIYIWDVASGKVGADCFDGTKPVSDMKWVGEQEVSKDLLLAIHPPYHLILWNTENGSRLWRKSYEDTFYSFSFDPFDHLKVVFLGQDFVVFVNDFTPSRPPHGSGKKFFISGPSQLPSSTSLDRLNTDRKISKSLRRVGGILIGESNRKTHLTEEEGSTPIASTPSTSTSMHSQFKNDALCLQLAFHQARKNHIILLYAREVLILDLKVNQIIEAISAEKTGSPFQQVISTRFVDAMICLHENGSISLRSRKLKTDHPHNHHTASTSLHDEQFNQQQHDVDYEHICQSDTLRVTKHSRVVSISSCPISEKYVSLVMSTGKVLIWKIQNSDMPSQSFFTSLKNKFILNNLLKSSNNLKFLLVGLSPTLPEPPVILRMCPPLTTKNFNLYQPLLAVGSNSGTVLMYNLSGGQLCKEYNIHSYTVRGIEWLGLKAFMSFAYQTSLGGSMVRNELMLTNTDTGTSTTLRTGIVDEEPPIEMIKVSYLKQYFCLLIKDRPLEVWDVKTLTLLRQMPKTFPTVTALEWSPSLNIKRLKKKTPDSMGDQGDMGEANSLASTPTTSESATTPNDEDLMSSIREHFVFTNSNGVLYHYIVEGNVVKERSKIPSDATMSTILGIAWKSETLVLTDSDGNMNIWDLKARVSRTVPTGRGCIKKVKFAPGRGNMKLLLLFADGCEVWDVKEIERISLVRCPRDISSVTSIDWSASDRPVYSCSDGTIRVSDLDLTICSSAMEDNQLQEPIFLPHSLLPKTGFVLKTFLQHQPWRKSYQLDTEELGLYDLEGLPQMITDMLDLMDTDYKELLLRSRCGVADRSLITANIYGDESEIKFWTVALYYLKVYSKKKRDLNAGAKVSKPPESLESCYDILCDNEEFRRRELRRIRVHETRRCTNEQTRKCADNLIFLRQTDRAVQLLLETEATSPHFYADSLKACLAASIRSSGASQSTIKLVATNLIAHGQLTEGVQLLCMIDKSVDACRYLQTYNFWSQAAWLSKVSLDTNDCHGVVKRWADHLSSTQVDQKDKAILILLFLGQFRRAVELLHSQRCFDRAALFILACQQFDVDVTNGNYNESCSDHNTNASSFDDLKELVFLEYSRVLLNYGLIPSCEYYCQFAGSKGADMLAEITRVKRKPDLSL